ncbi:MAG: TolC family protein [Steroidobacteraceae bacterium]
MQPCPPLQGPWRHPERAERSPALSFGGAHHIALFVLLGALVGHAHAADSGVLSYEEARTTLYDVSDALKASEAAVSRNQDEAHAAKTLGLPDLSVNAIEVFGQKTTTIEGTPLGNIPINDNFRGPRSAFNTTWSIYSGGRITATQKALAAGVEAANAELSHTEEDLEVLLAKEYFGLELAANVERTRVSVLEQAERQLDRAIKFEQQGIIARVERLSAQVARDEAAREQVSAQRDREIAEAALRRLLHREAAVGTSTSLFISTRPLKPLTEWLRLAESTSPTLAVLAARRNQAEQGVALEQSRWKPEIFAFGSYSMIRKYQTLIEPDWIAGVGVNFKIFSREDRASKVSAARSTLHQAESLQAAAGTGIATEVEAAFRRVEQAREQFKLLDSTIALAEENLRLHERGFGEGQATSLDVSDARNALARSKTARALAAYDYVIALVQLLQASGQTKTFPEFIQQADITLSP